MDFLEAIFPAEPPLDECVKPDDTPNKETVCAFILRTGLLTADQLGRALEVHRRTVYKWEDAAPPYTGAIAEQAAAIRRLMGRDWRDPCATKRTTRMVAGIQN